MSNIIRSLKIWFRIGLVIVVLSLALPAAQPAQAGSVLFGSVTLDCTMGVLDIAWSVTSSFSQTISLIVNGDTQWTAVMSGTPSGTTSVPGTGSMLVVLMALPGFPLDSAAIVCDPLPVAPETPAADEAPVGCTFEDGRLTGSACAAPVIPFCLGDGIQVYAVDPATSQGEFLLGVRGEVIEAIGVPVGENVILARQGDVILSRLTTGEFQLNAFDASGAPFVLVWDGCPPSTVYQVR